MGLKEVYKKYKDGDNISDIELKFGINEFANLEENLRELGEKFYFAWRECYNVLTNLESFKRARAKK